MSLLNNEQISILKMELRDRFLFVIDMWAPSKYQYKWLEDETGISASIWQNVCLEKQFPTLEMLIAIGKYQGKYLFWVMTGGTEHECPPEELFKSYISQREWIKQKRRGQKLVQPESE